jgi:hypothetical protein
MLKLSRRTLVATAAVLPALVVPAGAALASDEDPELLALGVEFEKVAVDWIATGKRSRTSISRRSQDGERRRPTFHPRISFLGLLRPASAASRNRVTLRSPLRAAAMILLIMTS